MITANALVAQCEIPLEEKWGYIWGASGETWTKEKQANTKNEMAQKYGAQWIGRRVCDCSGLFVYAFRELGGSIYHGSNTIWRQYCVESTKGTLTEGKRTDGKAIRPGSAVFLTRNEGGTKSRHHIGIYIGSNMCIEAKGTKSGVVASGLSHWDEVAELRDVSYDGEAVLMTLRRGCKGEEVKDLQERLILLGYDVGTADGIFGTKTEKAVKAYQQDHGLSADGVVGEKTRKTLEETEKKEENDMIDLLPAVLETLTGRAAALEEKARALQEESEALAERVEALLRLLEGEEE